MPQRRLDNGNAGLWHSLAAILGEKSHEFCHAFEVHRVIDKLLLLP